MGKKYLIDSNSLIEYTGRLLPKYAYATLSSIIDTDFNISFINKIEVLGHRAADLPWQNFIGQATVIGVSNNIIEQAIEIRKTCKIKIPDAIVAATAMVDGLVLVTRDVNDFKAIKGLQVENPWDWNE
jgi:predicted nucleic acid-binding protein